MKEPSFKACDSRGDSVMRRYIAVIALGSLTLCAPLTTAVAQDAALDAKIASMENENAMLKKRLRLQALEKENAALKKQLGIADNSQSRSDERPSIVREQRVASNGPVTIDSRAAASRPEIPDVLAYAKGRPYSKEGAVIDPPLPVLTDDWSGVYVGAEAGYGWGRQRFNDTFDAGARAFDTGTTSSGSLGNCSVLCETVSSNSRVFLPNLTVPLATANQKGWLAGGFFGAQKQWGSFALGLEADIDGANINGAVSTARTSTQTLDAAIVSTFAVPSATACPNCNNLTISPYPGGAPNATVTQTGRIDSKTDELGTLRGRVGFAVPVTVCVPVSVVAVCAQANPPVPYIKSSRAGVSSCRRFCVSASPRPSLRSSFGYGAVQHHIFIQCRVQADVTRLVGWRRHGLETHAKCHSRRALSAL